MWTDETGRAAKDHTGICRFTCPEVRSVCSSEQIYSQNLENKSHHLQDSRNCNFNMPWNTLKLKKAQLIPALTGQETWFASYWPFLLTLVASA